MIDRRTLSAFYEGLVSPDQLPEGYVYWWEGKPFAHFHLLEDEYAFFWLGRSGISQIFESVSSMANRAGQFLNQHGYKPTSDWSLRATCVLQRDDGRKEFSEIIRPTKIGSVDSRSITKQLDRNHAPIAIQIYLSLEAGRERRIHLWANTTNSEVLYPEVGLASNVPLSDPAFYLFANTSEFTSRLASEDDLESKFQPDIEGLMSKFFKGE